MDSVKVFKMYPRTCDPKKGNNNITIGVEAYIEALSIFWKKKNKKHGQKTK